MRGEAAGSKLPLVPPPSAYQTMGQLRAEPGCSKYLSLAGPGDMGQRDRDGLPQVLGFLLGPEGQVHQGDQDQPEEEQGSRLSMPVGGLSAP